MVDSPLAHGLPLPNAHVDLGRADRCGYPEVIYGPGKTPDEVLAIAQALHSAGQNVLATRLNESQQQRLAAHFATVEFPERSAAALIWADRPPLRGLVGVVTAGSGDLPVAAEALATLRWMGCGTEHFADIGVAGPQRLLDAVPRLRQMDAIVAIAGMEGALPSVLGGWVPVPVIAVPTSIGYGAHLGGVTTLLSMLTSCAANVSVVNIDAGFKGGFVAGLIARGRGPLGHDVAPGSPIGGTAIASSGSPTANGAASAPSALHTSHAPTASHRTL